LYLERKPARPYNWSNRKCKCFLGGRRRPKTLKREDLAPLPEIIKTYYVFIYLDTWCPDQFMLDYFEQRLSLHFRKSNTCLNARDMLPHRLGFKRSWGMTWASAEATMGRPDSTQ
jgi:hypothetical protein